MGEAFVVERAGHATIQDLGRPGHALMGVSAGGAADAYSARVANLLVGNGEGAALVEITGSVMSVLARSRLLLAVTGAAEQMVVDGTVLPAWEPAVVEPGGQVVVERSRSGLRSYLAVNGTLDAERVLGSVAPDALLGVGRRLHAGDVVGVTSRFTALDHPHFRLPLFRFGATRPTLRAPHTVDVTAGPEAGQFPAGVDGLALTVSPQSDQIGIRLLGDELIRTSSTEILSRGVPVGAVECPPAGGLIVLLRGRLVTAGYPVVAVATSVALDLLGQAGPGDTVTLRVIDAAAAVDSLRRRRRTLDALARRVDTVHRHIGLGHLAAGRHPTGGTAP